MIRPPLPPPFTTSGEAMVEELIRVLSDPHFVMRHGRLKLAEASSTGAFIMIDVIPEDIYAYLSGPDVPRILLRLAVRADEFNLTGHTFDARYGLWRQATPSRDASIHTALPAKKLWPHWENNTGWLAAMDSITLVGGVKVKVKPTLLLPGSSLTALSGDLDKLDPSSLRTLALLVFIVTVLVVAGHHVLAAYRRRVQTSSRSLPGHTPLQDVEIEFDSCHETMVGSGSAAGCISRSSSVCSFLSADSQSAAGPIGPNPPYVVSSQPLPASVRGRFGEFWAD